MLLLEVLYFCSSAYISFFNGEFHIISSLQSLQIPFKLTVVEEDLLHNISSFNETKGLLQVTITALKQQAKDMQIYTFTIKFYHS